MEAADQVLELLTRTNQTIHLLQELWQALLSYQDSQTTLLPSVPVLVLSCYYQIIHLPPELGQYQKDHRQGLWDRTIRRQAVPESVPLHQTTTMVRSKERWVRSNQTHQML